jgi:hypothetical protein
MAAAGSSARAAPEAEVPAVVVVVDGIPTVGVLAAAREEMQGQWRLATVHSEAPPALAPAPEPGVDDLMSAYLDADFLLCQNEVHRPSLDADRLLERGLRSMAAQVILMAAACALGAGDVLQARDLVRRLVARELDAPETLRRTTPDFQRLVDSEQQAARAHARVTIEIETDPPGASVELDGRSACRSAPCRMRVVAGEHLVRAEGMGMRPHTLGAAIERDGTLRVSLELASADEAARQLGIFLGAGRDPSSVEVMLAAATAFGAGVVVVTWRRGAETHATAYRRSVGRLTHVALELTEPDAAARAVRAALHEWRSGDTCVDPIRYGAEPALLAGTDRAAPALPARTLLRRRVIWGVTLGALIAGSVAMFLIARANQPRDLSVTF